MEYALQLSFLRKLLKDMNVSSCVLENPDQQIPPEIDLFLRSELFGLSNYAVYLQNSMSQAKNNTTTFSSLNATIVSKVATHTVIISVTSHTRCPVQILPCSTAVNLCTT